MLTSELQSVILSLFWSFQLFDKGFVVQFPLFSWDIKWRLILSYYRRSFTDDQAAIYQTVEERLETTYGLDGKVCVQRFICELTKNPITDYTFVGELITAVFS